jgi:hypothetical protein
MKRAEHEQLSDSMPNGHGCDTVLNVCAKLRINLKTKTRMEKTSIPYISHLKVKPEGVAIVVIS